MNRAGYAVLAIATALALASMVPAAGQQSTIAPTARELNK